MEEYRSLDARPGQLQHRVTVAHKSQPFSFVLSAASDSDRQQRLVIAHRQKP